MSDNIHDSDITFGRLVLLVSASIIVVLACLAAALSSPWWLPFVFSWFALGALSVFIQVLTRFGYIRLAPRFDAVISYTISVITGPLSLARTLWGLH